MPASTTLPTTTAPPVPTLLPSGFSLSIPAGQAVDLSLQPNGTWNAYLGSSCTLARQDVATTSPIAQGLLNPVVSPGAPSGNASPLLTLCRHDGIDEPVHGQIQAFDRTGYARTLNVLPLQTYLDGVVPAEESASWGSMGTTSNAPQGQAWGFQALEAQAVAARSFVLAYGAAGGWNGYATICDNTLCQAYVGANYEAALSSLAVSATLGQVLVSAGSSAVLSARYSASTGGWTAPGTFPAVRDRGDGCVIPGNALACNPNHTWQQRYSGVRIERRFPSIGLLLRVRVTQRNGLGYLGGRALSVLISGTKGRVRVSGSQFAAAVGLRSDWFAIGGVVRTRTRTSA